MQRRALLKTGLAAAATAHISGAFATDSNEIIKLWPGEAPGMPSPAPVLQITERSSDTARFNDRIAVNVAEPLMTVIRPRKPDGSAVLIAPGGGYRWVVIDKEGLETASRMADAGITVFVLRYRSPGDGWRAGPDTPLQDAQRAIRTIRAKASDYALKPDRVGVLGFSAGGHVAASLATRFNATVYPFTDATDHQSARPDFVGLMYPVITMAQPGAHPGSRERLLGATPSAALVDAYSCETLVSADTPPTFIAASADDDVVPTQANSVAMYKALLAAKVPAELHIFEEGGHGYGLRLAKGKPAAAWPDLFLHWGYRHNWFQDAAAAP
ncbi:MAG: alpha/beta hydrolase [Rhodospirillaceae bacterium]|nr:alpha/beta hydrolase [Rhodospirillaceae bacterium]